MWLYLYITGFFISMLVVYTKCNNLTPGKWSRIDLLKLILLSTFSWISLIYFYIFMLKTKSIWWNKDTFIK